MISRTMADHPRVPGHRRPHRKTRSGCSQCKQRRIKCDEGKPACGRCTRYCCECTYHQATAPGANKSIKTGSPTQASTPSLSHPATPNSIPVSPTPVVRTGFGHECNIQDLELIHFFTTVTSFTCSSLPDRQDVWQNVIPRIAFQHEFLLHGLLALSALHLSRVQPNRQKSLQAHATMHHETGLNMFRPVMSNITAANYEACFCFSSILVPYSSASAVGTTNLFFTDTSDAPAPSNMMEWCRLLRGVHTMIKLSNDTIRDGPLRPLFAVTPMFDPIEDYLPPENKARLLELEQLWGPETTHFSASEKEALDETLQKLINLLNIYNVHGGNICVAAMAMSWPIMVPEIFLTMVYNRQKEALVLLAHFCMLLTPVDHYWWIRGMARTLLQTIHKTIGTEWEGWIVWPLQDLVLSEFRNKPVQ
ncbi:hypothetical protein PVAG01_00739 [Phlyctema vagabunda]|uniref:Zn(2)-C6 fungal-type domain-containing protein n=1 Tax=Phlyctema vagabunda TaxID=108571 RepID=A0ABR4PV55_9HELO